MGIGTTYGAVAAAVACVRLVESTADLEGILRCGERARAEEVEENFKACEAWGRERGRGRGQRPDLGVRRETIFEAMMAERDLSKANEWSSMSGEWRGGRGKEMMRVKME